MEKYFDVKKTTSKLGKQCDLRAAQAESYQKTINNYRKLENLVRKLKDISLEIYKKTTIPTVVASRM